MSDPGIETLARRVETTEAVSLAQFEQARMRAYLREGGWLREKSWRNPETNRIEVKEIYERAGLANWFRLTSDDADKVVIGVGAGVGAPETKPIKCVDAGCRDALPDQVGWIATGIAAREKGGRREAYSRSGHACPHTCASFVRDFLLANAETRAESLTLRTALGIQAATKEELPPDDTAARQAIEAQTWEVVPRDAGCYKWLDGKGNSVAEPYGYQFKKEDRGNGQYRWILRHRTDAAAPAHPPVACEFHGVTA